VPWCVSGWGGGGAASPITVAAAAGAHRRVDPTPRASRQPCCGSSVIRGRRQQPRAGGRDRGGGGGGVGCVGETKDSALTPPLLPPSPQRSYGSPGPVRDLPVPPHGGKHAHTPADTCGGCAARGRPRGPPPPGCPRQCPETTLRAAWGWTSPPAAHARMDIPGASSIARTFNDRGRACGLLESARTHPCTSSVHPHPHDTPHGLSQ
jgi:hypothetical protein